jgi:hypothetical protein
MKLGADDPKKVIVLGALVVIGGYLVFSEVLSGPSSNPAASATPPAIRQAAAPVDVPQPPRPVARTSSRSRVQSDEFHPVLHPKRPEDRIDTAKVDPTLRLDLLAKVQNTDSAGPGRNVFQFGQAPLPPEPIVRPKPAATATVTPAPAPPPTAPPGPPPPPPITLRYYGFSSIPGSTAKTAFFLDGEDILVAKEGETVKRRYRVVRIGATSVVMEDTESKRQQTIPLAEEAAG